MPGDDLTHGPPANKKAGGSDHRFGRVNRHSLRNGVTAYTCSPRSAGLISLHRLTGSSPASLIPASGRAIAYG